MHVKVNALDGWKFGIGDAYAALPWLLILGRRVRQGRTTALAPGLLLVAACASYPNMRVYDWASDVKDDWFIEDGIHFTSPGYAARAQLIAQALAHAFPAKGETEGGAKNCLVS